MYLCICIFLYKQSYLQFSLRSIDNVVTEAQGARLLHKRLQYCALSGRVGRETLDQCHRGVERLGDIIHTRFQVLNQQPLLCAFLGDDGGGIENLRNIECQKGIECKSANGLTWIATAVFLHTSVSTPTRLACSIAAEIV